MFPLFNTIAIEIGSLCNRICKWCPVRYDKRADELMDGTIFNKVVSELSAINYAGRVELYIYNEPTLHMAHLHRALHAVRNAVPRACLMIATNGDFLRGAGAINTLYECGLNQLLINCYGKGLFARRQAWLDALPASVERGGPIYSYISPRRRTVQMLDKHDPHAFGAGVFQLVNRAGNIPEFMPPSGEPLQRMCVKPFRMLNINWRGDALVCCQDYHGEVPLGNVRDMTVEELWRSPVMNEYRRRLYAKDRSLPLCRSCDCHAGAYPGNVAKPEGPFAKLSS